MRLARVSLFMVCLFGAACDIPTEPPILQQRWILPFDQVTLDQSELLPSSVTIVGDQYEVAVADGFASETVGNLCLPCVNGFTGPAPLFMGTFSSVENLPNDVLSADVASGSVQISINNQLGWDPIAGGGSITITLAGASGGPVLGTLVLQSPADALPSGVTIRTMALGTGVVVGGIESTIVVDSPGGQNTTINTANTISMSSVTSMLRVWEAAVDVDGLTASLSEEPLDSEDLDEGIIEGILSGAVVMDVTNPFGLTYSGQIVVGPVTKPVVITNAATSQVTIMYTGDELRTFLGMPGIILSGSGTISGGPATVTPSDSLTIDPSLDLVVEFGGS